MSSSVPLRPLGTSGPLVPTLGFGAMGLSAFYGTVESNFERFKILDRAYELHARHWDTADMYGDMVQKNWEERGYFLATKFGGARGENGTLTIRSDPEYIKEACERSLRKLGVDCIDLYYCHRVDKKTPIELTVRAMVDLQRQVLAISLRRAHAEHHINALQMEYSPFTLDIESKQIGVLETARELGIALVAYSPLGRGFISGKYKSPDDFEEGDFRRSIPRFSDENSRKNLKLLMAQGDDIFLIPGTKKITYLEENVGSVEVTRTLQETAALRKIVDEAEVAGARIPQGSFSANLYADTPKLADVL